MKVEVNLNHYATIYPNKKGWEKIQELIKDAYNLDDDNVRIYLNNHRTEDDGYRDQQWQLISDLHSMFYNGQNYLTKSVMTLEPN